MPGSKPITSEHPRRGSWVPAQVLLQPSVEHDETEIEDLDLAKMDDDPFIYFLTPTPSSYDEDEGADFDMDFDAGIEDAKHPPQIVRSVSPSTLGGLSRPPPPRPPTPPRSPATPDLEYDLSATPDEHDEQYDYMDNSWPPARSALGLPRRLKDKFKGHRNDGRYSPDNLAPPARPHSPRGSTSTLRGRAVSRPGPKPIAAAASSGNRRQARATPARLSPHAWREPSPDVWDIEEETEQEVTMSEVGYGSGGSFVGDDDGVVGKAKAVDIPAAKPKKRVRFVLPAVEDVRGTY